MVHNLKNKIKKVIKGHQIKNARKVISRKIIAINNIKSIIIKTVFIKIPIPIEKTTSPFLYSFLRGLKKFLIMRESERI